MENDLNLELSKEEFSYGFIIEVLTRGLYPDKFHVIREYIQNSFDAICKWRRDPHFDDQGSISIKVTNNSILIFDNGTGMDKQKINQYRYVGYSEKRVGESTGFRGIGKLSGISVAEKLIVTSSAYGVKEKNRLIFDTQGMILEILDLKSRGENIALNELIRNYTDIQTSPEEEEKHYTLVELNNIRPDSRILLDEDALINFIGMNCPVDFDPGFEFGEEITNKIKEMVDDYETVIIKVGERQVYKPYITPCKRPEYYTIWKEESEEEEDSELLCFSWYCKNKEKGQFEDKERSGLLFRSKNFTIGDRFLTREKLWAATPEKSEEEEDSELLCFSWYCKNKEKGQFEETIKNTSEEYEEGKISKELEVQKIISLYNLLDDSKKRINKLPTELDKQKSRRLMQKAQNLIDTFKKIKEKNVESKFYDITAELGFDDSCKKLYDFIIASLQDTLVDKEEICEEVIKKIHSLLREQWK
ncbi:ATP-binding protein [Candidatus Pacearchaeota archaeon]|nr:ATP-binding protein [Candidatus Pacearchaeota archaeon]